MIDYQVSVKKCFFLVISIAHKYPIYSSLLNSILEIYADSSFDIYKL